MKITIAIIVTFCLSQSCFADCTYQSNKTRSTMVLLSRKTDDPIAKKIPIVTFKQIDVIDSVNYLGSTLKCSFARLDSLTSRLKHNDIGRSTHWYDCANDQEKKASLNAMIGIRNGNFVTLVAIGNTECFRQQ